MYLDVPTNQSSLLFGILRIPPFVNHKGKDVNSDWFADQWDERSVLGHAQIHKGRMKGDDLEIDTMQTPKRLDGRLALLEKIRKSFTDSIPNVLYSKFHTHHSNILTKQPKYQRETRIDW